MTTVSLIFIFVYSQISLRNLQTIIFDNPFFIYILNFISFSFDCSDCIWKCYVQYRPTFFKWITLPIITILLEYINFIYCAGDTITNKHIFCASLIKDSSKSAFQLVEFFTHLSEAFVSRSLYLFRVPLSDCLLS